MDLAFPARGCAELYVLLGSARVTTALPTGQSCALSHTGDWRSIMVPLLPQQLEATPHDVSSSS